MLYRIGELAELARVSIRLLHHYDEIGLLRPSARSDSGYRLYSRADLQRLQQILFYRTLEFSLEDIVRVMNAPDFDRHAALLQQRELLRQKAVHLDEVLDLLERTLADFGNDDEDTHMSNKAMFEVFPQLRQADIIEAEARWGDTDPWKQSAARTRKYRKEDWEQLKVESDAVNHALEQAFTAGHAPDSQVAIAAIEAARLLIQKWFYDCAKDFHVRLTGMTCSDERYLRNIDANCPGLAAFMHAAAQANLAVDA